MTEKKIDLHFGESIEMPQAPAIALEEKADLPQSQQFTEEEKQQIAEFSEKIDLMNTNAILEYGASAQHQIAAFSEKNLEATRTKDLEDVGGLLSGLVTELKGFTIEEEDKGLFGFLKKSTNKLLAMKAKYDQVESNVDAVKKNLEHHQIQLLKDTATMDQLYELNKDYFKELCMYIEAGQQRLAKAQNEELPNLQQKAQASGDPLATQEVNDFTEKIHRFEKRLHDLELTKTISLQMAPQIRMVQSSGTLMVEKIQSTLMHTIPLWKSQMVLALSTQHTMQATKAEKEVSDFTNKLLKENADKLKMASVQSAEASERSVVDLETVQHINESLISALTEVKDIQAQGHQRREEARVELQRLEGELKQALLEPRK